MNARYDRLDMEYKPVMTPVQMYMFVTFTITYMPCKISIAIHKRVPGGIDRIKIKRLSPCWRCWRAG